MTRKVPFAPNENYHVFNRGVEKRDVFLDENDYMRMSLLLFLCNDVVPVRLTKTLKHYQGPTLIFLKEKQENPLVDIYAYCLMPNHFHLVLRELVDGGAALFLQKLLTAYTMYFNKKYDRTGVLFQGKTKSEHLDTDSYFRHIFAYVHLNPAELIDPGWKQTGLKNKKKTQKFMRSYEYSSYYDYYVSKRPESEILNMKDAPDFINNFDDLEEIIKILMEKV